MKFSATLVAAIFLPSFISPVLASNVINNIKVQTNTSDNGGDANASVKVNNDFGSNNSSSIDSQTNVDIKHSGDGDSRSEVTINGETYVLEGPGSIRVGGEVNSNPLESTDKPTPTNKPEDVLGDTAFFGEQNEKDTNLADAIKIFILNLFRNVFHF